MKRILLTGLISFFSIFCSAQNSATPYRQFYFNPYLFNPAYAGINGYTEVHLSYRKQWLNFNDAPVVSGFSVQHATRTPVSLGLNVVTQDVVALRNTTAMATFGYTLPLTSNQFLRFGLSGGVGMNNLHLEEGDYDPNDPAIQTAKANSVYADGNFGAVYVNKGLRIGFALPKILGQKAISPQELGSSKFSQLKNQLYSISYKFNLATGTFSIEPYFIYRLARDSQNSWEAASVLYFKEKIWVGASYHQTNGAAFFLGMNIKDKFRFGYSYELPPINNDFANTNSHEIHLNLRLSKKKEFAKKTSSTQSLAKVDSSQTTKPDEPIDSAAQENSVKTEPTQNKPTPVDEHPAIAPVVVAPVVIAEQHVGNDPTHAARTEEKPIENSVRNNTANPSTTPETAKAPASKAASPARGFELTKGHYVVVGAFRVLDNASHYLRDLSSKGIENAAVAINSENNLYYVYIFSSYDLDETRKVRNQYRLKRPFSEAWIFTME